MLEKSELISKLMESRRDREAFLRAKLSVMIPAQIRALRLKRKLTQTALGKEAEMKQARISAVESPGEVNFNLDTIVRLASALRVGVLVQFVSFREMLDWENRFSQDDFDVVPLESDKTYVGSLHELREANLNDAQEALIRPSFFDCYAQGIDDQFNSSPLSIEADDPTNPAIFAAASKGEQAPYETGLRTAS